jgi:hypothetical protein
VPLPLSRADLSNHRVHPRALSPRACARYARTGRMSKGNPLSPPGMLSCFGNGECPHTCVDFELGFRYLVPQRHNLLLRVEFDYNRLTEKNSFEAFFQNNSFIINAEIPMVRREDQKVMALFSLLYAEVAIALYARTL